MIHSISEYYKSSPALFVFMTLTAAVLFPLLVHVAPPIQGSPTGAVLLPLFYVPLIALVLTDKVPALLAAIVSPSLNFLITGNEQWSLLLLLTVELTVFTLILQFLFSRGRSYWAVITAIVLAKALGAGLILAFGLMPVAPFAYFSQSLSTGLPGILMLLLLGFLLLGKKKNPTRT
ncbi:hypothetical protein [Cyclobacterium xiamenense]|uniref:hypothetical protein n=1 Tax=Cyclobacterium xiamenense TaxID=1297121 RepID=UPI0012B7E52D|nr:hypothetical protein [Cyclobacterium xiamenense]